MSCEQRIKCSPQQRFLNLPVNILDVYRVARGCDGCHDEQESNPRFGMSISRGCKHHDCDMDRLLAATVVRLI
jgi:hypothetical protein